METEIIVNYVCFEESNGIGRVLDVLDFQPEIEDYEDCYFVLVLASALACPLHTPIHSPQLYEEYGLYLYGNLTNEILTEHLVAKR